MKKMLLMLCLLPYIAQADILSEMSDAYQGFKTDLLNKTGLSYSLDVSFLGQRGAPNGKGTPWQMQYYGSANWNMFSNALGTGSAQLAYTAVRYAGMSADELSQRIGVLSQVNDYTSKTNNFDQLSYTHQLPGKAKAFSVMIGQFPMYNFDGTDYDSNQQINFLNYALSQNGSSAYPVASLGGAITFAPNALWNVTVGMQDANNVSGETISSRKFSKGKYTTFGSIGISPKIMGKSGQYSVLIYHQPSVAAQPEESFGWSLNMQQFLSEKIAVFGRINGTQKSTESIRQSYVIGSVINNPLNRNELDQIGLATALNKLNKSANPTGTRSFETVLESYWAWGISSFLTITPDVQFYINPGLNKKSKTATVASLRATLMF